MRIINLVVHKYILLYFFISTIISFSISNVSAMPVQVSELSAQQLYDKIVLLDILTYKKTYQLMYDKLTYGGLEGPYNTYCTSCCIMGENNHRVAITFFSNQSGCVSKIVCYSQQGDSIARKAESLTIGELLTALGLSTNEFNVIVSNFFIKHYGRAWCYATNRCIILELNIDQNSLRCVSFSATNEKPSELPIAPILSTQKEVKSYPTTEDDPPKIR
ncbi:hypothetical protein [Selenomonas ruminantium]|uniref:Uncharacterized protein n=1 Tax=Selenomonas ruminantium TaxID=971 RepID=A0A1I0YIQ5_SELRU|nr:hypothetical protein [Selenomonas ruminantium]SFB13249.1 hypothetical protein SAMN05216587_11452 [Selenomonas ruminantium]